MRKQTKGRKRVATLRALREARSNWIARDLDGFVHTSRGFLEKEKYESLRAQHPDMFPPHAQLPPLEQ